MLHATETGISSGRVGLWLVCAFTYLSYLFPWGKNLNQYFCLAYDNEIPPIPQKGKKSGISFNKVSGNQERKNNEKEFTGRCLDKKKTLPLQPGPRKLLEIPFICFHWRVNPGRVYQPSNYRMSYEVLLALEQDIDHLLGFTERDVEWREIEFY